VNTSAKGFSFVRTGGPLRLFAKTGPLKPFAETGPLKPFAETGPLKPFAVTGALNLCEEEAAPKPLAVIGAVDGLTGCFAGCGGTGSGGGGGRKVELEMLRPA
jgi:hypothetical protein